MKNIFSALALIWATPLFSMGQQQGPQPKIERIQVRHHKNGSLYTVDPEAVDTTNVTLGDTVIVGYDEPQTGEHKKVTGEVIAIKYDGKQ